MPNIAENVYVSPFMESTFKTPCLSRLEISLLRQCHQESKLSWGVQLESDARLFPDLAISRQNKVSVATVQFVQQCKKKMAVH